MLAAILCMAEAIYFESRSEPLPAQFAVAQVIQNRVEDPRYPDDACQVVHQPWAFSYYWDGKPETIRNKEAWGQAVIVAMAVSFNLMPDTTGKATHYHADYVSPNWATSEPRRIGSHLFYAGVR